MHQHFSAGEIVRHAVVFTEYRFSRGPDGIVRSTTGTRGAAFWSRYLSGFDAITVVGRVHTVTDTTGVEVETGAIRVHSLPAWRGIWGVPGTYHGISKVVRDLHSTGCVFILRAPGTLAFAAHEVLKSTPAAYVVEVVGDPREVFARGSIRHVCRPVIRTAAFRRMRMMVAGADAALYVTRQVLQARYPCGGHAVGVSDVELGRAAFTGPRVWTHPVVEPLVVTIGSLHQRYKGTDILLAAVERCHKRGLRPRVRIVGGGRLRAEFERESMRRGLSGSVCFVGQLPAGEMVHRELDAADVFVFPSRTEGMPRALLEAMARGLPCIASRVGGIPEVLDETEMVPAGNEEALAGALMQLVSDPDRMSRLSARNFAVASAFGVDVLTARRAQFYEYCARLRR